MRFCQLDKISVLKPGERIEASKFLSGEEDYLRDHFPRFAVMPGVLMLEALYQASAILVRETEGYQSGLVMLRTVKNVKFADFVQPGQTLHIVSELIKQQDNLYTLKASGRKEESTTVSGRLVLECVQDESPEIVAQHTNQFVRQLTSQLQQAAL